MAINKKKQEEKVEKITKEEAERTESIFFEDDEEVMLRDGKKYKIHPCSLKDARKLMKLLKTVQIEAIILNFLPDDEDGTSSEEDLFDILLIAFKYNQLNLKLISYVRFKILKHFFYVKSFLYSIIARVVLNN